MASPHWVDTRWLGFCMLAWTSAFSSSFSLINLLFLSLYLSLSLSLSLSLFAVLFWLWNCFSLFFSSLLLRQSTHINHPCYRLDQLSKPLELLIPQVHPYGPWSPRGHLGSILLLNTSCSWRLEPRWSRDGLSVHLPAVSHKQRECGCVCVWDYRWPRAWAVVLILLYFLVFLFISFFYLAFVFHLAWGSKTETVFLSFWKSGLAFEMRCVQKSHANLIVQ